MHILRCSSLIISFIFGLQSIVWAKNDLSQTYPLKMVGQVFHLSKTDKRNLYGFNHYFLTRDEKNDRPLAYPVVFDAAVLEKTAKTLDQKTVLVQAKVEQIEIETGEKKQKISVLKIIAAKPLDLSSLSPGKSTDNLQAPTTKTNAGIASSIPAGGKSEPIHGSYQRYPGPTIDGVNDTLTNTLIFSAGAVLLGTMFLGK